MSDEEDAARMALFGSRASRPAPPKAGNPFAEDGPAKKPPRKAESGAGAAASPAAAPGGDDEEEALRSDLFRGTSGEAGILARRRQEAERGDDGSDGPGLQHEGRRPGHIGDGRGNYVSEAPAFAQLYREMTESEGRARPPPGPSSSASNAT
ncbi:hypothetical protein FNF28_07859 [Cafeteria roenbergensis]|uniref:Uncharacterized protein n=1 Tax=Cafeteria roenbergensis TaxID=33653 RepID=A0A5A8BZ09_CAFRO|nr:hypothetical protein FNF28_07859 [Cafeteria roenbergensis]